ncbi:MAG: tetratricopeptide repeat protein [Candidatus Coatesbacteria bacterium]|nr:tetratricopeptide repeat protein [Candidatus Coatesbacteria bacterium]
MFRTIIVLYIAVFLLTSCTKIQEGDEFARKAWNAQQKGNHKEVIENLEKAVRMPTKDFEKDDLHTALGTEYYLSGEYKKAQEQHEIAVKLNPRNYQAYTNLGIVLRKQGKFKEAEEAYIKALDINSKYAQAHSSIGALYLAQNDYKNALIALKRAVTLETELPEAQANLSLAYALAGDLKNAKVHFHKAEALHYKPLEPIRFLIDNLEKNETRMSREATKGDSLASAGFDLLLMDKYDEAVKVFEAALKGTFNRYSKEEIMAALSGALLNKGENKKAMELIEKVLQSDPKQVLALTNKASCLYNEKKNEEAIEILEFALKNNPYFGPAWNIYGLILLDEKKFAEALKAFENSVSAFPGNPTYHANLALVYSKMGKKTAAEEQYSIAKILKYKNLEDLRKELDK